jgi:hypothetical protein
VAAQAVGEASDEDTDRKRLQDQERAFARICMRQDASKNDGILVNDEIPSLSSLAVAWARSGGSRIV